MDFDQLESDLRTLSADLRFGEPANLATTVMDRIAAEPIPAPAGILTRTVYAIRRRWRAAIAAVTGLLLIGIAVPPVRAAVTDWFTFGGVVVRHSPTPGPSAAPGPPVVSGSLSLQEARGLIAFDPVVPTALGTPTGVEVSGDRRILSFTWENGPNGRVRLDEFNGELSPMFIKSIFQQLELVQLSSATGWWIAEPHQVVTVDANGNEHTDEPRIAGQTMLWQKGKVTLRLEGNLTEAQATTIANSSLDG